MTKAEQTRVSSWRFKVLQRLGGLERRRTA